jgi:K+-transporting ATPase KdpF subunit
VSGGDVVGLVLAVAALGYLVVALLFPERLG